MFLASQAAQATLQKIKHVTRELNGLLSEEPQNKERLASCERKSEELSPLLSLQTNDAHAAVARYQDFYQRQLCTR